MRSAASVQLPADRLVFVSTNSLYSSRKRCSAEGVCGRAGAPAMNSRVAAATGSALLIDVSPVAAAIRRAPGGQAQVVLRCASGALRMPRGQASCGPLQNGPPPGGHSKAGSLCMRPMGCLGAIALCLARLCIAQDSTATPAANIATHTVIVRARSLIDGTSARPLPNPEIVIRGTRIVEVYVAGTHPPPSGAQVIDLGAATVLPGLIDCHTHIFLQGEVPAAGGYDVQLLKFPASYRVARAIVAARRALEQGFTTIRDVETEGAGYGDVGIKQAINEGYIPGPRMFVSTRSISTTGGYDLEGYAPEIQVPKGAQIIDGLVEARKAAREQLDHGADWIKVYMTHRSWLDKQGNLVSQPTLTLDEIRAIADEAHTWKKKVACHAYGGEGLHRALDGGCDSIEHGLDLDDAAVAQMVRQGTWLVPTIAVYYDHHSPADTPAGQRDRKRVAVHG